MFTMADTTPCAGTVGVDEKKLPYTTIFSAADGGEQRASRTEKADNKPTQK
jgi:hypothetical protein